MGTMSSDPQLVRNPQDNTPIIMTTQTITIMIK